MSESPDTEATEEELLADATSYASPLKPNPSEGTDDELVLVWGRFWGKHSGPFGTFFINRNHTSEQTDHVTLKLRDQRDPLQYFDPDQSPYEFLDSLVEHSEEESDNNARQSDITLIKNALEKGIKDPRQFETLIEALDGKDRESFKKWGHQVFQDIYKSDEHTFQIKGQILSKSQFETPDELEDDQSEHEETSARESDTSSSKVQIQFETSPVSGIRPGELEENSKVMARITGDAVSNLPESYVDNSEEMLSVPLPAIVQTKEESNNKFKLTASIADGVTGVGRVSRDNKIKIPQEQGTASTSDENLSPAYIVLGLGGLVLIILLVLLF